ncbi:MAG: FtsX-like permease family protein [Oscillospiraceae bacterium]
MGLILKHTLKSMWTHKIRTFLLLFCVSVCSLAAMLCFDMSGSLEQAVKADNAKAFGKADIIVTASYALDDDFASGIPESTVLKISTGSTIFTRHIDGNYDMLTQKTCSISGVDIEKAKEMGVFPNDVEIGEMQAVLSRDFAEAFGYSVGDTITLYIEKKQPADFTVCAISGDKVGLFSSGDTIVISLDSMKRLYGDENASVRIAYINLADDEMINSAVKTLEANSPLANVQAVFENEQTQEMIGNITRIFTVLFAVCLLLVIFVTVSASQRIITEKMPVIGTFRSLGISSRLTYTVLLGENIAYGLTGSAFGIGAYSFLRPMIYSAQFGSSENAGDMSIGAAVGVVIFCVMLECLCPIKEILSAVKTSIRDIIFSNKDTQYKHGKASTITGMILTVVAVVTAFFSKGFFAGLICFVSTAVGAALLFPYILRFLSGLLIKIFDKQNKPIAGLAAVEAREKKSTVGSAVLCFTAAAICIMVYSFASSLSSFYSHENYSADLTVSTNDSAERTRFSYIEDIEGVSETEYCYFKNDMVEINGEKTTNGIPIYGWKVGGYSLYSGVENIPDDLAYDEVMIGKGLARKYGLSVNDTAEIVFGADGFMPSTKKLIVRGIELTDYENSVGTTVVISEKLFKELYKDIPSTICIKCSDPEKTSAVIKNHSADMVSDTKTHEEYRENVRQDSSGLMVIIDGIIALALGITFIGVVSNCLIGFEGRKRECAVLMSTSLTKEKLSKMFVDESAIASGSALITAIPLSFFMYRVFLNILDGLMVSIPIHMSITSCIVLGLLMWAVFTLSALFPIKALRKMNIAAQLKYE